MHPDPRPWHPLLCFLVLVVSTSANSDVTPHFTSEPLSTVQKLGGPVTLLCTAEPPWAHISWLFNGELLERISSQGVDIQSGHLTIPSLGTAHIGQYQCIASTSVGAILSRPATVSVAYLNDFETTIGHSVTAEEGSSEFIGCKIPESNPKAHVRYKVRGKWLKESSVDKYLILPSGNLHILNVSLEDRGTYRCAAYNPVTHELKPNPSTVKLSVNRSPQVDSHILHPVIAQTVLVQIHDPLTLECVVGGVPNHSQVYWYKGGKEAEAYGRRKLLHTHLVIEQVQRSDAGNYSCVFDNGSGVFQRVNYTLTVLEPPSISQKNEDQSLIMGSNVRFSCESRGNPSPNITWFHNAVQIHPSAHHQISGNKLRITNLIAEDSGIYQCFANNGVGSAQVSQRLTVKSVPYEMSTKPEDITPLDLTQSDEGDYDSETRAPSHSQLNEHEPESRVTEKPYSGASLPEAPIILSPPQTTKPDMYNLMWRSGKDGGLPINAYFVRYRKLDDDGNMVGNWNSIRVPASENEFPLTELESSSLYEVLMVARNAAGEGQPAMLTFRTSKERSSSSKNTQAPFPPIGDNKQTVIHGVSNSNFGLVPMDPSRHSGVPEAPDRPTISTASETSVYVTWIPRANGGSPITSFKVEYKRTGGHWNTASENIPPSKLSVEVSNLEPGGLYKFRVIAINNYGESRRSTVSRPYQVAGYSSRLPNPLIVGPRIDQTEAVTDTQILLKWTYIPENNNNTPIQGFYIYYRPTDSDNDSDYKRDMVEGTKQRHLISHLQPETSYDIKMQCFNERGASDYSNVMMCETKARRGPGASEYPVLDLSTPSVPDRSSSPSHSPARSGDFLYVIVGCVLGGMVLILMAFIAMCLLKNRQQTLMQKFEPPGYLYQGADLNGQIIEYTTLPGTSRINGSVHTGFMGNGNLNNGCPHIHHKVHNRASGVGNGEMYPGCNSSLKETYVDYERLPHHLSNGRVMYTALPQTDPTECINCRNCCNNNRCFTKPNGSYCGNGVAVMPVGMAPQQDEGETNPLNHVMVPMCLTSPDQRFSEEIEEDHNEKETQLSTNSICVEEATQTETEQQEGEDCNKTEGDSSILTWAPLILPAISKDCNEKHSWTSTDNTLDKSNADQPQLQTQEA
ncbi:cell adhesion molecule-related/down-regulated by oncogenes isoform X3 [Xenopus tropicalis]|uniref:Cell adhesion molecule-related/down-regulated by oncogenes isoform X3 n=1 Tax=Xenopus tropicalis TaxID=8364 RepID=A0A8J1JVV7_XENTR|nr:cell adhesion molecule-related/down-regulated by oncogenes isoform X3 [Xenopus tropicalis]